MRSGPSIITVSGLYSGIGKTLLCEHLLGLVPGCAAVKVTINDLATEVLDNDASLSVPGKDTWRLKAGGAAQVIWVRAQEHCLRQALADALSRLGPHPRLLVEGNSALEHLRPDLAFFVCDSRILSHGLLKPSRAKALAKADIVIDNSRRGGNRADITAIIREHAGHAELITLDLSEQTVTKSILRGILQKKNFLPI